LPQEADQRLRGQGATYYVRNAPDGHTGKNPDDRFVRLVTSFASSAEDIDNFVTLARS
jgi:threonine aldolase